MTIVLIIGIIIIFTIILTLVYFYGPQKFNPKSDPYHPMIGELKKQIKKMDDSFEKIDIRSSDIATTKNKEIIFLCTEHPKTGKPYKINHLTEVLLHEMAHYYSESYAGENEHNEEFMENYGKLIDRAVEVGIYDPSDPTPSDYCKVV